MTGWVLIAGHKVAHGNIVDDRFSDHVYPEHLPGSDKHNHELHYTAPEALAQYSTDMTPEMESVARHMSEGGSKLCEMARVLKDMAKRSVPPVLIAHGL